MESIVPVHLKVDRNIFERKPCTESSFPVHLKVDRKLFFKEALYRIHCFPFLRKLSGPLGSGPEGLFEGSLIRNPTFRFTHPLGSYKINKG